MRRIVIIEMMLALSLAISMRKYEGRGRRLEVYDFREHVKPTRKKMDLSDLKLAFESRRGKSQKLAVLNKDSHFKVLTGCSRKVVLDGSNILSLYNALYYTSTPWILYVQIAHLSGKYLIPFIDWSSKECVIADDNLQPMWRIAKDKPKDLRTEFSGYIQFRDGDNLYIAYMRQERHRFDRRHRLPIKTFFCLWDPVERKSLWEIESPGPLTLLKGVDVDGDGFEDIPVKRENGENGFNVSGATNMGRVQFWILDRFGNVFFRRTYWGLYADVYAIPWDFDDDGIDELLMVNPLHYTFKGGSMEVLDPREKMVVARREFDGETPEIAYIADLNGDGKDEIILGTSMGKLKVYDFALCPQKVKDLSFLFPEFSNDTLEQYMHVWPLQVCDFDGDGRNELLVALQYIRFFYRSPRGSHNFEKPFVLLLDADLNVLRRWEDQYIGAICDLDGDGTNELVLSGKKSTQVWRFKL